MLTVFYDPIAIYDLCLFLVVTIFICQVESSNWSLRHFYSALHNAMLLYCIFRCFVAYVLTVAFKSLCQF